MVDRTDLVGGSSLQRKSGKAEDRASRAKRKLELEEGERKLEECQPAVNKKTGRQYRDTCY